MRPIGPITYPVDWRSWPRQKEIRKKWSETAEQSQAQGSSAASSSSPSSPQPAESSSYDYSATQETNDGSILLGKQKGGKKAAKGGIFGKAIHLTMPGFSNFNALFLLGMFGVLHPVNTFELDR